MRPFDQELRARATGVLRISNPAQESLMRNLNVGILIYNDVEVLDFAGPFEVFSRTRMQPGVESRRSNDGAPFNVYSVAKTKAPVLATGGLEIIPKYDFATSPAIDLLVVPGGWGSRKLMDDEETLAWIRRTAAGATRVVSICTGALLLAKAGLLSGKRATTHGAAFNTLKSLDPTIDVVKKRFVDEGVVTSAGISAGIDMALYVVEQLMGPEVSDDTAAYMEY